jgi:hypothetical protein
VAAFSFRGECRIDGGHRVPPAVFTGPRETLRAHDHRDGHAVLLAKFTPAGAAAFLRPPLDEFAGTTSDLTEILGRPEEFMQLREQLIEAQNHVSRVKLLEAFLVARIGLSEPDPLIAVSIAWLEQAQTTRRINDLVEYIGLGQSALERRFRRVVGLSPKRFSSFGAVEACSAATPGRCRSRFSGSRSRVFRSIAFRQRFPQSDRMRAKHFFAPTYGTLKRRILPIQTSFP